MRGSIAAFALAWLALCVSLAPDPDRALPREHAQQSPPVRVPPGAMPARLLTPALPVAVARPPLVLVAVNGGHEEVLVPMRDDGGFSDDDLQRAAEVFSHRPDAEAVGGKRKASKVHALAPRLLDLVYRTMRHFDAKVVHVVSGFRRDRAGSRHTQGRAVDMTIDGVSSDRLAAYLRELGFVGVGFYPRSGFVHLDVRDASYFWIDDSAPDEPSHLVQVHEAQARSADAAARARGEQPDVFVPNNRVEDAAAAKAYARRARKRQTK
jgi:uncharacterized protein YcbK (DUF882 family)